MWSSSPAVNTSKIHLPVEQFLLKNNQKLAERLLYKAAIVGREERKAITLGLVSLGGNSEKGLKGRHLPWEGSTESHSKGVPAPGSSVEAPLTWLAGGEPGLIGGLGTPGRSGLCWRLLKQYLSSLSTTANLPVSPPALQSAFITGQVWWKQGEGISCKRQRGLAAQAQSELNGHRYLSRQLISPLSAHGPHLFQHPPPLG